ncbi:DUF397 domain-containing protein [Umezawaea sp. Da 62-37]|uniref:DUF397 domain-containing protein n=1 Tax=Umezawaea sp. Da 62-37 TaxID=3075927 RepID=UPI0028F6C3BA|nr:DUF397 domain-containing protein [Umezawaea sp. Da 62-37]WNV91519.1 DUF397 domain-containing protein [Umezawaea sp. Da 62-37]
MKEAIAVSTVDFTGALWRKSSRSGNGNNGACVEVAHTGPVVGVRDSKNAEAGTLAFPESAWAAFLVFSS